MASFMMSYEGATLLNTDPTRDSFSAAGTSSYPAEITWPLSFVDRQLPHWLHAQQSLQLTERRSAGKGLSTLTGHSPEQSSGGASHACINDACAAKYFAGYICGASVPACCGMLPNWKPAGCPAGRLRKLLPA